LDGFFGLETQPKKVAVLGAGYIATELAGVFHGLGADTTLFCREDRVLRSFDPMLSEAVTKTMIKTGIQVIGRHTIASAVREADGTITLTFENGLVSEHIHHMLDFSNDMTCVYDRAMVVSK
jgi:glutathione reductase (NADPH)